MLVPSDLRWAPWKLAHGLMISRFCDVLHASFTVRVVFFSPRGLCLSTLFIILRDWYLVNSCLRATSLLNEIFRKSSNFENFVGHRVPLHPLPGLLACRPWTSPLWILLQSYYKTFFFTKKLETFVAPARELELLRWLQPFSALVRTKMSCAASAC